MKYSGKEIMLNKLLLVVSFLCKDLHQSHHDNNPPKLSADLSEVKNKAVYNSVSTSEVSENLCENTSESASQPKAWCRRSTKKSVDEESMPTTGSTKQKSKLNIVIAGDSMIKCVRGW